MSTSTIEREPGGAKRRSTLKATARKATMVGVGVSLLGSGAVVASTSAQADGPSVRPPQVKVCIVDASKSSGFRLVTRDVSEVIDRTIVPEPSSSPSADQEQQEDPGDRNLYAFSVASAYSTAIFGELVGGDGSNEYRYLDTNARARDHWVTIPAHDGSGTQQILKDDCTIPGSDSKVKICVPNGATSAYRQEEVEIGFLMTQSGVIKAPYSTSGAGVYPTAGFGDIIPSLANGREGERYLTSPSAGLNYTTTPFGGKFILDADCNVIGIPTPVPGTNTTTTVNVPGPTVTVTATPSVSPSAVAPVAVAPVAVAPVVTPSAVRPVAAAPVAAAVPTAVNAGDGSSENRPMSPVSIVLLALAGVGVLYAALKLSTRRRSTSSQ